MPENVSYIPNRIKNASKGGHVAGASDIIDDNLGLSQEDINADTYRKGETYSKDETYNRDEINTVISNTPETDVVVLDVAEGSTALDTLNEVPLADRPNKLFRVRNDGNTHYDEYGWTGTVWGLLASKDYGIDDEPTGGSANMVKSDGITKLYGEHLYNHLGIVDAVVDSKGRILQAFYKDGRVFISGLKMREFEDRIGRIEIVEDSTGKILSYRLPNGMLVENSIRVERHIELGEEVVSDLREYIGSSGIDVLSDPENWDFPEMVLNELAVKKAESMIQIKWTPKRPYPKRGSKNGITYFEAGVEQQGLPYGLTWEFDKAICFDVSLVTFMTAVNNPYSLVYTEVCSGNNSTSAWGTTYHGISDEVGPYYGNVCTEFTAYCQGFSANYGSKFYPWLCEVGKIGKVLPQSAQGVRVGDLLYRNGHCALIKAVQRNESGMVKAVVVSEQSGLTAHNSPVETPYYPYTKEDFNNRMEINNETLYRSRKIARNADMFEFDADNYVYNDDICSFAGDKACFREGELIVLNYDLDGEHGGWTDGNEVFHAWTAITLYKNNVLVGTYNLSSIDQSSLPEGQRGHALKFAGGLSYGSYKATMTDGNGHYSSPTEFVVIQTNVTVDGEWDEGEGCYEIGDTVNIEFSSENATPVSMTLVYGSSQGGQAGIYEFSENDIADGRASINMQYFVEQAPGAFTEAYRNQCYKVKVFFVTQWGRVTNQPIKVKFTN